MQDPNQAAYYRQQQEQYAQQQRQTQTPSRYNQTEHGFNSANWEAEQLHYGLNQLHVQAPAGQPVATSPAPQPMMQSPPPMAPPTKKRAARAYHNDQAPAPAPGPAQQQHPAYAQPQHQPQFQDVSQIQAQQQQQQQHFQQPGAPDLYAEAQAQQQAQMAAQPAPVEQPRVDPRFDGNVRGNIQQPPHAAGVHHPSGARSKIDVDMIPSPVYVNWVDQRRLDSDAHAGIYATCSREPVPLPLTDCRVLDQGNCSPRFMRASTYILPTTDDLAQSSHLPLGLIVQPLAPTAPGEHPVPVADFSNLGGPPRCGDCRAYINPWCTFVDGGTKFKCNLCGSTDNPIPPEYYSYVDPATGQRLDPQSRPELSSGSVDFIVPEEYWVQPTPSEVTAATELLSASKSAASASEQRQKATESLARQPEPLKIVFAIDVSWTAGRSGMLFEVLEGIRDVLYGSEEENEAAQAAAQDPDGHPVPPRLKVPPGAKIAIITYDRTVHFYNLKAGLEQPQMLVVPDLDDMFSPLADGLLVDPYESRSVIETLLTTLASSYAESQVIDAALGGAVKASLIALKQSGGQVNIFHTSLPAVGPGALRVRDETKLYGTDKERTLFAPQDPFYRQMGEECTDAGVGVNLFLFPSQYIDVASIGVLSGLTGGELFFHPRFSPTREGRKLRSEIEGVVSRETAYSVTMRMRCSNNLRVTDHFGNFFQRNTTDLEFGTLDADKAIAVVVKHEGKLHESESAYFQCAVLYTSASGQRRVRCHNLALGASNKLGDVFRVADMGTTIALVAKESITQTLSKTLKDVRETLTEACVKVLVSYRKFCAAASSAGQLILPESYKLFPVFALGLMKSKALKGGSVASDVRTYYMRLIKSIGVAAMVELLYPRFFPLHNMAPEDCTRTPEGRFLLPPQVRCSYQRMEAHGAYLIENGETAILWLGASVSPALLQDLYGVDDLRELDTRMTTLPNLPTHLSQQVRGLVEELESRQRHRRFMILIARQGFDGTEMEFANMLTEDNNNDGPSYPDYLSVCHQQIGQTLAGEKRDAEVENSQIWRSVF